MAFAAAGTARAPSGHRLCGIRMENSKTNISQSKQGFIAANREWHAGRAPDSGITHYHHGSVTTHRHCMPHASPARNTPAAAEVNATLNCMTARSCDIHRIEMRKTKAFR